MSFDYDILPERKLIVQRLQGRFALNELIAHVNQFWSDPRYSPNYDGLVDLSSASVSVSMEDYRAFVGFVVSGRSLSTGRWAAVATTPLAVACAMIYSRAARGHHVFEVFGKWEEACAFLGADISRSVHGVVLES